MSNASVLPIVSMIFVANAAASSSFVPSDMLHSYTSGNPLASLVTMREAVGCLDVLIRI